MMPSGPHRSTMGRGERSSIPTVVFRLCGHPEIGPKPVSDQSRRRMSVPISPPPKGKLLLFPELAMLRGYSTKTHFCTVKTLWHTSVRACGSNRVGYQQARPCPVCPDNDRVLHRSEMSGYANIRYQTKKRAPGA